MDFGSRLALPEIILSSQNKASAEDKSAGMAEPPMMIPMEALSLPSPMVNIPVQPIYPLLQKETST